jgi:hypothetical protein
MKDHAEALYSRGRTKEQKSSSLEEENDGGCHAKVQSRRPNTDENSEPMIGLDTHGTPFVNNTQSEQHITDRLVVLLAAIRLLLSMPIAGDNDCMANYRTSSFLMQRHYLGNNRNSRSTWMDSYQ